MTNIKENCVTVEFSITKKYVYLNNNNIIINNRLRVVANGKLIFFNNK